MAGEELKHVSYRKMNFVTAFIILTLLIICLINAGSSFCHVAGERKADTANTAETRYDRFVEGKMGTLAAQ